jgi:pyruvate/2-oxoglutarate dehydrogenase complex dihydrolipoamide acyltransferase (E2) component
MYEDLKQDEKGRWHYQLNDELGMLTRFSRPCSCSITTSIDMTDTDSFREKLEKETGVHISITSFIIKAAANAVEDFPILCGKWEERIDRIICPPPGEVNVGGLIKASGVKTGFYIEKANKKTLIEISKELDTQMKLVKGKEIPSSNVEKIGPLPTLVTAPHFRQAFGIGTLGMTGYIESCFAQIEENVVSSLLIGTIIKKPVVRDDEIVIRKMMNAVLIWDERATVAWIPAEFLTEFKRNLEEPDTYLI